MSDFSFDKDEFEDTKGGNQNLYIEEGQTMQWPKDKGQNTAQKTKDRATRTSLNPRVNSGAPEGKIVPALVATHVVLL